MPILEYHLVEGQQTDEQIAALLLAASAHYAAVLACPVERVRVVATLRRPQHVAVGGRLVSDSGAAAPYFHFLVLEGRSDAQCSELLAGFTRLAAEILGVAAEHVRGGCWPVPPRYWSIGGIPAGTVRGDEIAARAALPPA